MNKKWFTFRDEKDVSAFVEMFWQFHDFLITDISYRQFEDTLCVRFEYDDENPFFLMLFFDGCISFQISNESGNILEGNLLIENNQYKWIDCDNPATYFKGNQLKWAIVNKKNKPVKIPKYILRQNIVNTETGENREKNFYPIPLQKKDM